MRPPITAVHHTASKLNVLIVQQKWHKAYAAADLLDNVMAHESGDTSAVIYTFCTFNDLAEERFKRASYAN